MSKFFKKKSKKQLVVLSGKENSFLRQYKKSAEDRGYEFTLTQNQFRHLINSKCFYCGAEPREMSTGLVGNGVDRVDNSKGYYYDNVISCCTTCNKMKSTLSYSEFIDLITKISNRVTYFNNLRNEYGVNSLKVKSYVFNFGRYLSPNELIECVRQGYLSKKDIKYNFNDAITDFFGEYRIVLQQLREAGIKTKKFTFEKYKQLQNTEWNML